MNKKQAIVCIRATSTDATHIMSDTLYRALRVYFHSCVAYGFARSVSYDYKGTKRYYNEVTEKREEKDMLLVDKIGRITGQSCAAVIMWPGMLGEDLARLECAMRGKDHMEYQ